jgi:hypothetical protein
MFFKGIGIKLTSYVLDIFNGNFRQERQHLQDIVDILQEPTLVDAVNDRNRKQAIELITSHHLFKDNSFACEKIKFFIIATHVCDKLLAIDPAEEMHHQDLLQVRLIGEAARNENRPLPSISIPQH